MGVHVTMGAFEDGSISPCGGDEAILGHGQCKPTNGSYWWRGLDNSAKASSMALIATRPARKRRLPETARPTKMRKLSTYPQRKPLAEAALTIDLACMNEPETSESTSPTALELSFALPGLSSDDTQCLLGELLSARHELSYLNGSMPSETAIHPVFGWRTALWNLSTPAGGEAVVYKSAKAFESVPCTVIARKIWNCEGSERMPALGAPKPVYTISENVRIVRQTDCLHERASLSALWIESIHVHRGAIYIIRKQLFQYRDLAGSQENRCERECHGYVLQPLLVPVGAQVVAGTALHCVSSLRTRGKHVQSQIALMVDKMPQHLLQWEDSYVHSEAYRL